MNKVMDCIFCQGAGGEGGREGCVSVFPACVVISFRSVFVQLRARPDWKVFWRAAARLCQPRLLR